MPPPLPCPASCRMPRGTHSLQAGPRPRPRFREGQEPCSRPRAGVGLGVCSMQLRSRGPAQTSLQDLRGHDADAVRDRVQGLSCPRLAADLTRNRTRTRARGGRRRSQRSSAPPPGRAARHRARKRALPPRARAPPPGHAPRLPAHAQRYQPRAVPSWRPSGSRAGPPASSWPAAPRKVRLARAGSGLRALPPEPSFGGERPAVVLAAGWPVHPAAARGRGGGLSRGPAVREPRPPAVSRVKVRAEPDGRAPRHERRFSAEASGAQGRRSGAPGASASARRSIGGEAGRPGGSRGPAPEPASGLTSAAAQGGGGARAAGHGVAVC